MQGGNKQVNIVEVIIIVINAISIAIGFTCISYVTVSKILNERINFIWLLLLEFTAYTIVSIVFVFAGIPCLIFVLFFYLCIQKILLRRAAFVCLISTIIFVTMMITMNLINYMIGFSSEQMIGLRNSLAYNIYNSVMCVIISLIFSCIFYIVTAKYVKNQMSPSTNKLKTEVYVVLLNLVLLIITISAIEFIAVNVDVALTKYLMVFGIILACVFVIFSIISIWLMSKIIKQKSREIEIQKDKEITEVYKNEIQNMCNEVRDFKHDYMKIYSSMSTLIASNSMEQLKFFFEKEIIPLQQEIFSNDFSTYTVTNIKDDIIQGLIYSYIIKAKNHNISFIIDVQEKVPKSENISSIDLSRALGILLDNAFEASIESEKKEVIFGIVLGNANTTYVIKNSYGTPPDMSSLLSSSYSTKGEKRGRGLTIVNKIFSRYNDIYFNVKLISNYFISEVLI